MRDLSTLQATLRRIDGRGYKAYRDLTGAWALGGCMLHVDHVQADPFAAPSKIRMFVADPELPANLYASHIRALALEDYLARRVGERLERIEGRCDIDEGEQEVLERCAIFVDDEGGVEIRLSVGLPAAGRRILGRNAHTLLSEALPRAIEDAVRFRPEWGTRATAFVDCVENQEYLRSQLAKQGLVAFIGDGSVLPRESGISQRPLEDAVPFVSPEALATTLKLIHPVDGEMALRGLGIPEGVTLIVGGGFHGKSTLLRAIERGIHPHIPGDGREWVVTRSDAVKIRAEDGRRIEAVDVSPFIGALPGAQDTHRLHTDAASGSTSQAAAISEALEAGARLLLMDEDTCASNFMVRDARMQALIATADEPIIPFVDRIEELFEHHGISSVLVMGGSGDYLDGADLVLAMRHFLARDRTEDARDVAQKLPTGRQVEAHEPWRKGAPRQVLRHSLDPSKGKRSAKVSARDRHTLVFGSHDVDLQAVEQLFDPSQVRAIAHALVRLKEHMPEQGITLIDALDAIEGWIDEEGLESLTAPGRQGRHPGALARPRRYEVAAALNRLRTLRIKG